MHENKYVGINEIIRFLIFTRSVFKIKNLSLCVTSFAGRILITIFVGCLYSPTSPTSRQANLTLIATFLSGLMDNFI